MKQKVAIVILADTTQSDGLGRVFNGLVAAKEYKEANDEVQVIFSGAGTKWMGEIANPEHKLNGFYNELHANIVGACGFCAGAFGVAEVVKETGHELLEEYGTNMSFRRLTQNGFQVITF